ncbi:MAG TPA: DUF4147 domain-containing protein [Polyangiaceae bacterium]|jgi:hydroxypyruvate reductase
MNARELVLDAFRAACARVDLAGRVRAAVRGKTPLLVIACGKAASAMLAGVDHFERALVVIPRGFTPPPHDPRVMMIEASHPVPDESSVRAADAALALAASDSASERLFLVSGGTSSLLCAPNVGLERMRAITRQLLDADASIGDLNVVRRHLSRVKGGGLARACGAHPRRTLIVSDVLSNAAHDVGSGPSVADPTTIADAKRVAARVGIDGDLPWVETWKTPERFEILADPAAFAELVREELARRGATDVELTPAEPALRIPSNPGRGGRCTHAAAVASLTLRPGEVFAALATDGVDGPSQTGGAIVDRRLPGALEAIARFDTAPLHEAAGTAVPSAPTGLNFTDLHIRLGLDGDRV